MTDNGWDELGLVGSLSDQDRAWKNGPRENQAEVLEVAERHIRSVDYKVSLRWVFYRLWQDGFLRGSKSRDGKKAGGYGNLRKLISRAVHSGIWSPDWLADENRNPVLRDPGSDSFEGWLEDDPIFASSSYPEPAFWKSQKTFVTMAYEANAMTAQFEHHVDDLPISLWPFGGQPSNPYKKRFADYLSASLLEWNLPAVVLYFGDLDPSGEVIGETPAYDVRKWAEADDLRIWRVGLYSEQAQQYGIPENPDKPGEYQWEALSDDAAGEVISEAIDRFIDRETWNDYKSQFDAAYQRALGFASRGKIEDLISDYNEELRSEFGSEPETS